ncbi:hypothetical protein [Streptomyces natalensis]|uniref:Uncharacterized protein n=1 Tax=Streptomyces natalensis ATCC 27448 TaxID=1240678 RepID=A0A0D7CDX0_9ACTN|nr:hypothetical protein [Streptomyces natalensis]KIZ14448.1 hypothetical protein SNA_35780 [Streptomyces natalensis ATCC 27448]
MPEPAHKGKGRVTAFSVFGPVFGYTSELVDDQQIAYVGPLTPGVQWPKLWQMAARCCRDSAQDREKAQWITTQATRAFIMHADLVTKLPDADWHIDGGGHRIDVCGWSNHDALITGNMAVPDLTPEQVSMKYTYYPHYFVD